MKSSRGILVVLFFGLLSGCASSPLLEGNEAFVQGDFGAAESHWRPLAASGNADAQHNLGVLEQRRGNPERARSWWRSAVAQEFVPSMVALAALEMSSGQQAEAIALYRRAARWADSDAVAALEAFGEPIPHADLWLADQKRFGQRQQIAARQVQRPAPNESLNRFLDEQAALER